MSESWSDYYTLYHFFHLLLHAGSTFSKAEGRPVTGPAQRKKLAKVQL